ncbi:MAG: TetR/AcrR family transcriptional regulator [Ardenticatenaceae bacterium]|nr:TetR/AcrR family transcriptional regulator [Ardenticatenaceae bacterium]
MNREIETDQLVIEIATRLFAEKGFNGTGVAEIAKAAGITNAGLYYHVSSKQELLYRVLESGLAGFLERLEQISEEEHSPLIKLQKALDNHLDFIFQHQDEIRVFLRERRFLAEPYGSKYQVKVKRYDRLIDSILAEGMASGHFQVSDIRLMRLAILGMINWIAEWYKSGGPSSELEVRQEMKLFVIKRLVAMPDGLTPPHADMAGDGEDNR